MQCLEKGSLKESQVLLLEEIGITRQKNDFQPNFVLVGTSYVPYRHVAKQEECTAFILVGEPYGQINERLQRRKKESKEKLLHAALLLEKPHVKEECRAFLLVGQPYGQIDQRSLWGRRRALLPHAALLPPPIFRVAEAKQGRRLITYEKINGLPLKPVSPGIYEQFKDKVKVTLVSSNVINEKVESGTYVVVKTNSISGIGRPIRINENEYNISEGIAHYREPREDTGRSCFTWTIDFSLTGPQLVWPLLAADTASHY